MSSDDIKRIAEGLTEAQRDFLLRYNATADKQPVPRYEDICTCNFFVELDGRDVFFARGGSHKPAGTTEFQDHYIAYNSTGLAVRAHLQGIEHG